MLRSSLIVAGLAVVCCVARSQEQVTPNCAGTTPEVNACVQLEVDEADKFLNKMYTLVIKGLKGGATDPMFGYFEYKRDALVTSERAWVKFRDAQCLAVGASYGTGTGKPAGIGQCLITLTKERVKFVKQYGQTVLYGSVLCRDHKEVCAPLEQTP